MEIADSTFDPKAYFGITRPAPKAELNFETFLQLLTVQLSTQNPLEPMNDRDFFAQMAQLGQVEGLDKLQSSMQLTQGSALIGKTVTAVRTMTENTDDGTNQIVTGKVERLSIQNGEQMLTLRLESGGTVDVRMGAIRAVEG